MHRAAPWWAAATVLLVTACGGAGDTITVEFEFTGERVDEVIVEYQDRTETVSLPWRKNLSVSEEDGASFGITATNTIDRGTIGCRARWGAADAEWDREGEYQVRCSGLVRFDAGFAFVDPRGFGTTFAEREAELAEEAAEDAAEQARQEAVAAVRADAGPQAVLGDWQLAVTGVLRDAEDLVAERDSRFRVGGGDVAVLVEVEATWTGEGVGRHNNLVFELIGGFSTDRFPAAQGVDECGLYPNPVFQADEPATGDATAFNVCWIVPEEEAELGVIVVDDTLSDADPVTLLLPAGDRLGGPGSDAAAGQPVDIDEWTFELQRVVVNDFELLRSQSEIRDPLRGKSFVYVEFAATFRGPFEGWPVGITPDVNIRGGDGVSVYGQLDGCGAYRGSLYSHSLSDPGVATGETALISECWEVDDDALAGAVLFFDQPTEDGAIDLGL